MSVPSERKLSEQDIKDAKELFDAVAGDKDKINLVEFKRALKIAGFRMADIDVNELFDKADSNHTGGVTWPEFLKVVEKRPIMKRVQMELNAVYWQRESTQLDKNDLTALLEEMGATAMLADIDKIIKAVDKSGDGKVSFEEFATFAIENNF